MKKTAKPFGSSVERSGSEKEQKAKARTDCAAFLRLIKQWDLIPGGRVKKGVGRRRT